jgi:hypothetical protein
MPDGLTTICYSLLDPVGSNIPLYSSLFGFILISFTFFLPIDYLQSDVEDAEKVRLNDEENRPKDPLTEQERVFHQASTSVTQNQLNEELPHYSKEDPLMEQGSQRSVLQKRPKTVCRRLPFVLWFAPALLVMFVLHFYFQYHAQDEKLALEAKIRLD